jgi:NAD(P)-dependent dehydrogenase (short-subunit alcohol dehydrogenase family)
VSPPAELPASFRLDGRVAVVVGGTGALGGSMAVGRDRERGERVAQRLRSEAGETAFEQCDASDRAELRALVERVLSSYGRIDVLVNSAGTNAPTPFLEIDDAELERIVAANVMTVTRACQEFGRYFVERASTSGVGASIVNVGSESALTPLSRVFTYSMTKAAVHNLTRNLAREWGPLGIRCNVLVPGFFPTELNRTILDAERTAAVLAHTPLGRFGEPDDLAGATLLLASDAGRFITGAELVVDGGFDATAI